MAMWRSSCRAKTLLMVLLVMTILYNIESAGAGRILTHKHSPKHSLSTSKHSPAVGHMQVMRPYKKMNTLKNKLPSGPSPGVGNAYINDGGVKSGWRSANILKTKLPSGPSPGIGH